MNKEQLIKNIKAKKSFLCVGLDPDTSKMPESLKGDLFELPSSPISHSTSRKVWQATRHLRTQSTISAATTPTSSSLPMQNAAT